MADEKSSTESTESTEAPEATTSKAEATATEAAPDDIPRDDEGNIIPTPGDVRTEPVSTAAQSGVAGRVGPPSIQQDAAAPWHSGEGVEQIAPGQEADAATPVVSGPVAHAYPDPATYGAGPYGAATPADPTPNAVSQTIPGTELPTVDELPAGTPQHAAAIKVTAPDPDAPASPSGSASSPSGPGSADAAEPADSDGGSSGDPAGTVKTAKTSDSADAADSAGSTKGKG